MDLLRGHIEANRRSIGRGGTWREVPFSDVGSRSRGRDDALRRPCQLKVLRAMGFYIHPQLQSLEVELLIHHPQIK